METANYVLPLAAHEQDTGRFEIRDANGRAITGWGNVRQLADQAEFIVRACNSHDDLVAALQAARARLEDLQEYRTEWADLFQQIDAALVAAGAE